MQDKKATEVVGASHNILEIYYNKYVKGIDYATIGVTILTFFTFVLQPLFVPSMSLATFLELGFYGNVIMRTALLVIIQKTYQRFARRNQLSTEEYKEVKQKLVSSKNKVEAQNIAYDLEHYVGKKSLEERCYGLKDFYDLEINDRKTSYDRKKYLFDRKQQLIHFIATIQNDDLDLVLYEDFASELSNFRHLDIDSAQLFVSGDVPKLAGNKYQVDVVKEEARNVRKSIIASLAITLITTALIFTRNPQTWVIDMLIMLTLMTTNIVIGSYRGIEIYLKIHSADTQKEILLSSFFGAISQKGKIEDVFEKAYQKTLAAEKSQLEAELKELSIVEAVPEPEKLEHKALKGQMQFKID